MCILTGEDMWGTRWVRGNRVDRHRFVLDETKTLLRVT